MEAQRTSLGHLSDQDLLTAVARAASDERASTVDLIAALIELDTRRLYLAEGCSSLFTYCMQVLHLSEHAAYGRIAAARLAVRFPVVLNLLADGSLNLTTVCMLAPHVTAANHDALFASARHKSKRDVEQIVVRLAPKPDAKAIVRKLPEPKSAVAAMTAAMLVEPPEAPIAEPPPSPAPTRIISEVRALAPERFKVQFTVNRDTHDTLQRARDLLRHSIPSGDPGAIFARALELLVETLEKRKLAVTNRPRATSAPPRSSRYVPAAVRRIVSRRDEGRCAFVGPRGRCTETGCLEFHHVTPFAVGGLTTADNLQLRCRAHNL